MDVQTDDADTKLSTLMASVVLGEQADVVIQAVGEAVAESGTRSALGTSRRVEVVPRPCLVMHR